MLARFFARSIILSRIARNAFLLSLSRSAGMDEYADSIAMSFASAKWTFINCSSCSILSKLRFDKSLSGWSMGCEPSRWAFFIQRRADHIDRLPAKYPTGCVRFGSVADVQDINEAHCQASHKKLTTSFLRISKEQCSRPHSTSRTSII